VLAWLAAATSRIKLGAGIFQIPARSAAMTAIPLPPSTRLSGGRMLLGLGSSGPQVSEGWHGVRFARQLQRTREYVAVVRMALEHKEGGVSRRDAGAAAARWPGEGAQADRSSGARRGSDLSGSARTQERALAGEIADGWLPVFFSPEHTAELRTPLEEGARARGGVLTTSASVRVST